MAFGMIVSMVPFLPLAAEGGGAAVVLVVATRSQEGHMVRVVAGSCM